MSRSGQLGLRCSIEPNYSGLSAHLAGASVIRDRALDTCEPSYVPRAARPFFIPMVHSPLGPWGTWQHRSSPLGEVRPGPRDSAGAHLGREVRSGAEEHVAASERTLAGRRGPELRNAWWCRSSTQQGDKARGRGKRGGSEAHLWREVWSEATAYVAVHGCMLYSLS
jgi:hypothetical protein